MIWKKICKIILGALGLIFGSFFIDKFINECPDAKRDVRRFWSRLIGGLFTLGTITIAYLNWEAIL
jgi:hypothetical protein